MFLHPHTFIKGSVGDACQLLEGLFEFDCIVIQDPAILQQHLLSIKNFLNNKGFIIINGTIDDFLSEAMRNCCTETFIVQDNEYTLCYCESNKQHQFFLKHEIKKFLQHRHMDLPASICQVLKRDASILVLGDNKADIANAVYFYNGPGKEDIKLVSITEKLTTEIQVRLEMLTKRYNVKCNRILLEQ